MLVGLPSMKIFTFCFPFKVTLPSWLMEVPGILPKISFPLEVSRIADPETFMINPRPVFSINGFFDVMFTVPSSTVFFVRVISPKSLSPVKFELLKSDFPMD